MLKKFYDKSRIAFALTWIVAYCALMSAADVISSELGTAKIVTLPVGLILSAVKDDTPKTAESEAEK